MARVFLKRKSKNEKMNDKPRSLEISAICFYILFVVFYSCTRESGAPPLDTLPTAEQVATAKADVEIAKASLAAEGKFKCCIKPPCDWCLLKANGCVCADMIDADQPVCPECGLGWKTGAGSIPDVQPHEVKNVLETR
jgi:hypothetical protein